MYEKESRKPPVEVGQILELPIMGFGKDEDPMMKHEGYVLFLRRSENVKMHRDQVIKVRVTKLLAHSGFVELIVEDEQAKDSQEETEQGKSDSNRWDNSNDKGN